MIESSQSKTAAEDALLTRAARQSAEARTQPGLVCTREERLNRQERVIVPRQGAGWYDMTVPVAGFPCPVVPMGQAGVRMQSSAAHAIELLNNAPAALGQARRELELLKN